jgi:(4S)-4-hydroxy-5-phosphonooxypentane-2,3-dione isomerase
VRVTDGGPFGRRSAVYGGIIKLVARAGGKSELVDFLRWDAELAKAQEPRTLRFDVWESASEPDVVYLYEAYVDRLAFEAHAASAPFKQFVEEIVPTLAEPPTFVVPFTQSVVSNADD